MDFEGLIEFNKYTLAVAAASFVYTLETFVPAEALVERYVILAILAAFFASSICGIFLFAASTKALHGDAPQKEVARRIQNYGTTHAALLVIGMVGLAAMLIPRILRAPDPARPTFVYCVPPPAPSERP